MGAFGFRVLRSFLNLVLTLHKIAITDVLSVVVDYRWGMSVCSGLCGINTVVNGHLFLDFCNLAPFKLEITNSLPTAYLR